jgi:nucleoside-diphosphate-sugar epimerase
LGHTETFLVRELLKEGWEILATDLGKDQRSELMKKECVFENRFCYPPLPDSVKYIAADLRNKESLYPLFNGKMDFDVIFHPASLYDYFAPLDLLRSINVGGLQNFLDVILEISQKSNREPPLFVHWSTCGVYGEPKYKRDEEGYILPINEDWGFDPPNNYSISKKEQEELLMKYRSENNLKYIILRSAPIYGPFQTYGMFHIYYMCHKMGSMACPDVWPSNRKLMMPMIHVEDLVRAAIFLANRSDSVWEAYNIIADSTTEEEWMEFVFQELGIYYFRVPIPWWGYKVAARVLDKILMKNVEKARKKGVRPKIDPPMIEYITHNYYFSNAKLKATGFKFLYPDFMSGTRQTIRWYKDNGWFESEPFGTLTVKQRYSKKSKEKQKEVNKKKGGIE